MEGNPKIIWPGWNVEECIGKGGYGAVYEIRREVFGDTERCALKVITIPKDSSEIEYMRCEGLDDESITTTLHAQVGDIIREYKMMSQMRENPNIVHCDDFRYTRHEDDLGWDICIKMELLTPLMKVLDQVQTEEQIVRLGKDMCSALTACQKYNIIHRDIKPQNIFLSPEGYFKLGDFGIARTMEHTTRATAGVGTYSFMAPEVALGKPYGPSADIYSLGLVLYWLLNERRGPFAPLPPTTPTVAVNEEARLRRYSGEPLHPPKHGSDGLKAVVLKACSFDPEARYQTAQEMSRDLDALFGESETKSVRIPERKPERVPSVPDETEMDDEKTLYTSVPQDRRDTSGKDRPRKKVWPKIATGCAMATLLGVLFFVGSNLWRDRQSPMQDYQAISHDSEPRILPTSQAQETLLSNQNTHEPSHDNNSTIPSKIAANENSWAENVLMRNNPVDNDREAVNATVFDSEICRRQIKTVTFLNSFVDAPNSSWDVSEKQDGSVLAWAEKDGTLYDLYIAGEGGINGLYCEGLFQYYSSLQEIHFNGNFHTQYAKNLQAMFYNCRCLKSLDISNFNTSNVRKVNDMFLNCKSLTSLDVSCFDTANITNMSGMFSGCGKLTNLDLSKFDTSKVLDMSLMFDGCGSLKSLNVSGFNTSNVENMHGMFSNCASLTSLDVSSFDTAKVTDMGEMFHGCRELSYLDISSFDTSYVRDMHSMFYGCSRNLELDVGKFDASRVIGRRDFMERGRQVNGKPWEELFAKN